MPPPYISSIRDQIYYECAVLMSRAAFGRSQHAYVYDRFKLLRDGRLTILETIRTWEREAGLPRECVFCGSHERLPPAFLIAPERGGENSPDNTVLSCAACDAQRGQRGIFEWLGLIRKDDLDKIVSAKYLHQLLIAHAASGTLDLAKDDIGGLCHSCPLPGVCEEWASEGKLTCFCLESILPRTAHPGEPS